MYTHAVIKVSTAQTADYSALFEALCSVHWIVSTVSAQHWITLLQQSEGHFGCHPFSPVKCVPLTSPHLQLLVVTISENESLKQTRKRC